MIKTNPVKDGTYGNSNYAVSPGLSSEKPIKKVLAALQGLNKTAKSAGSQKWQAQCPGHDDQRASLSITESTDGTVAIHCHAGCDSKDVLKCMCLEMKDLFQRRVYQSPRRIVETYDYQDESGKLLYQAVRYDPKGFSQRRPNGNGGWIDNMQGVERVLYRLPDLIDAELECWVFIVEGEKDVNRLYESNLIATCNVGGAGKWRDSYSQYFKDRNIVILPDNDSSGKKHAAMVAGALHGIAGTVKVVELPDLPKSGDVSDWMLNGGTKQRLIELVQDAKPFEPVEPIQTEFVLTDLGNGERFASQHSHRAKYCDERHEWLCWTGRYWKRGENARIRRMAAKTVRSIIKDVEKTDDYEERKGIIKFAKNAERTKNIDNMLKEGRSQAVINVESEELDSNKMLFNIKNKTMDLRVNEAREHDPADLITKMADVKYDPDAKCPLWLSCIDTWMDDDQEKIDYLQRLAGYCLSGDISERVFPIFYGAGRNGKSVFCNTIANILGDYATVAPKTLLVETYNESQHPTDIAALSGRRLVIASETKNNMRLRVSLVKEMTGELKLTGRFMRQDFFDFIITHKIILMTNSLPIVDDSSDSIWDRVHLVEWPVRIKSEDQDSLLLDKLRAERSGILNWLLAGCQAWQENHSLNPPQSIRDRTEEYRRDSDPLREFLDECCIVSRVTEALIVGKAELRGAYEKWCGDSGIKKPFSVRFFNNYLKQNGYTDGPERVGGKVVKCWRGIGLQAGAFDFE